MRNSRSVVLQACRRAASAALGLAFLPGLVITVETSSAQAQTYTESVLYSFTGGADGANPVGPVIRDVDGNLYGTTELGGAYGKGVVYKVSETGVQTVLHSFAGGTNKTADGAEPYAGLLRDKAGNLYGTTTIAGGYGWGAVFKVTKAGHETVLYRFTGPPDDGGQPWGPLIQDAEGNLYGMTQYGGTPSNKCPQYGCGVVFKLTKTGQETVLYKFSGGADGGNPVAGLLLDAKGKLLYGTTPFGGDDSSNCYAGYGCGVVFKLTTTGKETVLHTFTGSPDGQEPLDSLVQDSSGNLYGTTWLGGTGPCYPGTIFKVTMAGKETVMHDFQCGTDGSQPLAGLVLDAKGKFLYGTTSTSPCEYCGTVFKVTKAGHETVLYNFPGDGAGGLFSQTTPVLDSEGNLYGTTTLGGAHRQGTVYKLTRGH